MARAVARIELENGVSFTVKEGSFPLRIGRHSSSDVCVPLGEISRRHCELYLDENRLCLRDTSTNGTMVAGRKLVGESVPISGRTPVFLTAGATLLVIPCENDDQTSMPNETSRADRRTEERRKGDRRTHSTVVDFERRRDQTRRVRTRRASNRY